MMATDMTLAAGIADPARSTDDERRMGPAMLRGWCRRCPACGQGRLLRSYLKVNDHCPACDEALHHHRADDGPAYLTIMVVGKLLTPLLFWVFVALRPDPVLMAAAFSVTAVVLSLVLLPRFKGLLVGIQWSRRMHGFGDNGRDDAPAAGWHDEEGERG